MSRIGMIALVAATSLGFLFACGDKNAPLTPSGVGGRPDGGGSTVGIDGACGVTPPNTGVSFKMDIQPLMVKACSCHVTGSIPPLLGDYASVKASAEISEVAITNGTMPINGPLSPAEQALFASWLQAGMPNN